MANKDPSNDAHEARMPVSLQAADATAQPDDQTSSSDEEVVPLFDIIDTFLEELPALREAMSSRRTSVGLVSGSGLDWSLVPSKYPEALLDSMLDACRDHHAR